MTHTTASKFKSGACKVLRFLQLVDRNCNLSITNIAVIGLITKMMIIPAFDWPTAAGLMMALLNYSHKRTESAKAEKEAKYVERQEKLQAAQEARMMALEAAKPVASIEQLEARYQELKQAHDQVAKVAEEAKRFMSGQNLASAFQTPNRNRNRE